MSIQQTSRSGGESHKARDWANSLINRFEEQLPYKASPQASHTRLDLDDLKHNLVQISRHRFSEVVLKLAEFLRRIRDGSTDSSSKVIFQQRQYYESAMVLLDILRRCFDGFKSENPTRNDNTVVKDKLLPEICQILRISSDHPHNVEAKNLAIKVIYSLSSNFFTPVHGRINSRVTDLCKIDNQDYSDIELLQYINLKVDSLVKFLIISVDKVPQLDRLQKDSKRSALSVWLSSLDRAISNWMEEHPEELAQIQQQEKVEELDNACRQLFDIIEPLSKAQKKAQAVSYMSLLALLLGLPSQACVKLVAPKRGELGLERKTFFNRMLSELNDTSRPYAIAVIKFCKTSTYVESDKYGPLYLQAESRLPLVVAQVFGPEARSFLSSKSPSILDLDIMIDCFLVCLRLAVKSEVEAIFQICLAERAPVVYQFALVSSLYKMTCKPQLPWWPRITTIYPKSLQLRNMFSNTVNKLGYTLFPMKAGSGTKSKDQGKSKDRADEVALYNNIMVHLVKLIRAEPMLLLSHDAGDKRNSTMSLFKSLASVGLTSPSLEVSHEAQQALVILHQPDKIKNWDRDSPTDMFWDVSYEILMAIARNLADLRTDRDKDLLKWLRELLNCRNDFLAQNPNYAEVKLQDESGKIAEMTTKIEEALFIHLWNIDMESVLTAISCFLMLTVEAEICSGSDDTVILLPNNQLYLELFRIFTLLTTANKESKLLFYKNSEDRKDLQYQILAILRKIEKCSPCIQQAWDQTFKYWLDAVNKLREDCQSEQTRSAVKRRTSHQNSEYELEDRITEWVHMTGFLCALGGVSIRNKGPDTSQHQQVVNFISRLLEQFMSNDKCSDLMHKHAEELIEHQLCCSLYPILFNTILEKVSGFFDEQNQVHLSDINTLFICHMINIMRAILDKSEQESECGDITNIEILTITIVRYVRFIESLQASEVKINLCQLIEIIIKRRDNLRFRQEIKFRNKLVEYLSEWIMCNNTPMLVNESGDYNIKKLDEACMQTLSLLLHNLPLHPEDSDGGEQAKLIYFTRIFTLFINLLTDCHEALADHQEQMTKENLEVADKLHILRDHIIQAMSNLLSANIDCGLLNSISFGYFHEPQTRAAFLEVLTKILQQGTAFDMLAETSRVELHKQLVQLVTMISDKGELPIAMALATVVRADEMDELARVLVNVFESKHLLSSLLWNIFDREVAGCENVQTLFRGNSLGTKIMSLCCQLFGAEYLQKLLNPLIVPMLEEKATSYEVDPAKLEPGADIERNRANLVRLTNEVFNKIVSSVDSFPSNLRMMCHCLYQVLCKNYPSAPQNTGTVGTILFLRFINPAIVSPQKFGIIKINELPHSVQRGLMFMSKILQNIANRVDFNKEQHMVYFNKMLRENQERAHEFFIHISKDVETSTQTTLSEIYVTEPNHAALHRLLYIHQEGINNYLSSSRDHGKEVGRRPFDKLAIVLANLGEPQPKSANLDLLFPNNTYNTEWIRSDQFSTTIEETVKNLNSREKEEFINLKKKNIFYESGVSKKKHMVFYYIARKYKINDMNINLLYLHVMMSLQATWNKPFELVVDLTYFSPENRFRFEHMEKWLKMASSFYHNLVAVYFYNCNSDAREFIKIHSIGKNLGERVHFVHDTKKLEEFITKEQQRLPGSTVTLENDLTIYMNALKLASKDIKVTIKVGPNTVQVSEKSKILGQLVYVNDVYYASEIEKVQIVDDNQFTVTKSDETLSFIHNECEAVVQSIMHIRSRWLLSLPQVMPDDQREHTKIRPKDVPGTLLNMSLLNLGSPDPDVRTAAYNLLCALTATFNLKISRQLHMTTGLCIPLNNTAFIKRISKIFAVEESHLTIQFLEEWIQGFRVSSSELKHLCLEYMMPWLNNLARYYKPSEESSSRQKQINQILEKLITLTIEEREMLPSIQTKIWSTIGKVPEVIDAVLENFIQRSLRYGIDSPMVEVMANTTVALASSNVDHVSDRAIKLLEKVIKNTATTPTTQLEQNAKWPEIAIHVRHLVMMSFNNCLDVGKRLPKLFHMITLLVCSGNLTMRASVYRLVINVIHSLCTCSAPTFSEDTYKVLKLSLGEFSLPKFLQLFGISNVKTATLNASRSIYSEPWYETERIDVTQDYEEFHLTNLEIITDAMLEVMEACIRDMPTSKWLEEWTDLARNFAFSHNRALKPRALIVFGCISKHASEEDVKMLLKEFVNALDRFDIILLEAIVMCLTRMEPLLDKKSPIHRYLFWVALSMLQMDNALLYSSGLALLEQNLQIMDTLGLFHKDQSLEQVIMATREPLEPHFNKLDTKLSLSFKSNFHFALVGYLLKGYWHPNPGTVTRNVRVLTTLLDIVAKSSDKKDKFEVTPQNVAYLSALVSISDEVRKRCHLRHTFSSSIEDFGCGDSSSNRAAPLNTSSSSSSPAQRRQKSWDQLDQTALTQAKQQKRLLHQRSLSVPSPKELKDKNRVDGGNVLLNPDVITDPLIQTVVLAVFATIVKHSTSEDQARILYEYLAESSFVFGNVFSVIYNFLDQKILNIVSQSCDQRTLNAVQTIILNGIACEDTSNSQLCILQNSNLSGLWRFSGSFLNNNSSPENAQYFLDLFKAMDELIWSFDQSHFSPTKNTLNSSEMSTVQQSFQPQCNIPETSSSKLLSEDKSIKEHTEKPDTASQAASSAGTGSSQP